MRVHELAKSIGVATKELMAELRRMKVQVEHHSNSLDDETIRKVMAIYQARQGRGVVKKITRKAGDVPKPASATPIQQPPAPATGAPRLIKRKAHSLLRRPSSEPETPPSVLPPAPLPPMAPTPGLFQPPPPAFGRGPGVPAPEGPPAGAFRPVPPPPMAMPPPPVIEPPMPVGQAGGPMTIEPPRPIGEPVAPPEPQAKAPPQETTAPKAQPTPSSRRPVKRERPAATPSRRGTTIDLDTFKTVVTGDTRPAEARRGKSRRDGHTHHREGKEPARADKGGKDRKFQPSFLLSDVPAPSPRRPGGGRPGRRPSHRPGRSREMAPPKPKAVTIYGELSVGDFAQKVGVEAIDVMKKLMEMGEMLSINALLSDEMAEILATELNIQLTIVPETDEYDVREYEIEDREEDMIIRPPVVTVMGHVDHGKTSLLDKIRSTRVAAGEAGGITQHIGASSVQTDKGEITLLDTPGHEAFTAMRARGADVTDLVVLVVAADDSVMPQTIEAINHAKAANVPIIVAINKMDLPGANADRVKQGLMVQSLVPEELGGDLICCPVSAETGEGIDHLLDMILLQSEVLELQANPKRHGEGVVVESRLDTGRGVTATVLVQKGTLRIGDAFLSGPEFGKIRAMNNHLGQPVEEVGPGHAGEIVGLRGAPEAGESFLVVPNERIARTIAERRASRRRQKDLMATSTTQSIALAGGEEEGDAALAAAIAAAEERKELKIILRADVQGSVEAVSQSMQRLATEAVSVQIIHSGVGAVTVSDVNLAVTTGAEIIGFGVRPESAATQLAERQSVTVRLSSVIYELIDEVKAAMVGLLEPTFEERPQGRAEIRQVFRVTKVGNVAGCYMLDGEIQRSHLVRIVRDNVVVVEKRRIGSLRRVKDDVAKVTSGMECGIAVDGFKDIKEGDIIEAYVLEEIAPALQASAS